MSFGIQFTSEEELDSCGELTLNDHAEAFESSFRYWERSKYEAAWAEALKVAVEGRIAALVVWIENPALRGCVDWWPIYPVGDILYFQNAICDLSSHTKIIEDDEIYQFIPKRTVGEPVSEWGVPIASVEEWLEIRSK